MTRVWIALTLVVALIVIGAGLASDWPPEVMVASTAALALGFWLFIAMIRGTYSRSRGPTGHSG